MNSEQLGDSSACTYRFLSSLDDHVPLTDPRILIRQQPVQAKQSVVFDRERRPLEPPPIVQITFGQLTGQETMTCLQSPYYFMTARLVTPDSTLDHLNLCDEDDEVLTGSVVSSLHRLKDIDNQDAGFFVFGDLAIKIAGVYRIHFSLFEMSNGQVITRDTIATEPFTVYSPKQFPGPLESTFLSRTFADQGVRMRIRKEHRMHSKAVLPNKRKADEAVDKTGRRTSSSRQRNHSVRFVHQNSMYRPNSKTAVRRPVAPPGPLATPPEPHDTDQKDYHVGKFRFEREDSRQLSNSPPMELLALYAERASKELAQPKLAEYPSPPHHQHHHPHHVKAEQLQRHQQQQQQQHQEHYRKSIPSPPTSAPPLSRPRRDPPSMHTLPMPVRTAIPNSAIPPPTPLSVHRSGSEIRLPSIRDLMGWSPSGSPQAHRPQEEEIARAMVQLASDPI